MSVNLLYLISKGIKKEVSTPFHLMMDFLVLVMCVCIPKMIFFILPAIPEHIAMGTMVMTIGVFMVALTSSVLWDGTFSEDERDAI